MGSYKPLKEKEKNLFYKGFPPFPFGIFPTHHSVDQNRSDRYLGRRKNKLVRGETIPGPAATTGRIVANVARHAPDGQ
jgi:hypothetical protein